jgi:hypothetical protein
LSGLYQQIADELRMLSTYYVRPTLSRRPGRLQVVATGERLAPVDAPPQLELILDASGSMKRKISVRMMIDDANDAMVQIIEGLPDGLQVGLRVYGHRIRQGQRGDCQNSELVFPFAKLNKPRVGFALADEATKREMQQIAERTGGHFFDAQDAKALRGAIEQALAVPYDVLDAAGSRVASGVTGPESIAAPEGVSTVVVRAAGKPITIADVRVAHDQFTRIELKKEGQEVGMQVLGPVQRHEAPWAVKAAAAPASPRDR